MHINKIMLYSGQYVNKFYLIFSHKCVGHRCGMISS